MRLTINSQDTLSNAIGVLRSEFKDHKYFTVSITIGKGRSANQNRISHLWYNQVSKELAEHTPGEVKCLCKYHFGLPIMREDEKFNGIIETIIEPLVYEDRIKAMEILPVTSLMTTTQLNIYMEAIQKNFFGRVELLFPED